MFKLSLRAFALACLLMASIVVARADGGTSNPGDDPPPCAENCAAPAPTDDEASAGVVSEIVEALRDILADLFD